MPFKNSSIKWIAAVLASVMCAAMLHAQNSASTNESETNTANAPAPSPAIDTNGVSSSNSGSNSISTSRGHDGSGLQTSGGRNHEYAASTNLRNVILEKTVVQLTAIAFPFLFAFGLPIAIIVTVFYFRHRQNVMVHETIRALVERGVPVTPELIAGLDPRGFKANAQGKWDMQRHRNRYLLPGLILTGAGFALIIALPEHSGPGGLIILFIGFAFLIVWLVERKLNGNDTRGATGGNVQPNERKPDNDPQPPKI